MNKKKVIAQLAELTDAPVDVNHEITFQNPWEAKAFALVLQLHQLSSCSRGLKEEAVVVGR